MTNLSCAGHIVLLSLALIIFLPTLLWWYLSLGRKACAIDVLVRTEHSLVSEF